MKKPTLATVVLGLLPLTVGAEKRGSELLLVQLPDAYEIVSEARDGNLRHVEMVPIGETVETWSEMLTTQIFLGGIRERPERFYDRLETLWEQNCPDSWSEVVREGEENGYPFRFWISRCDENPQTGKPEITFFKAIEGRDSFYLIQKAWRRPPAGEEVREWSQFLAGVHVCDSRKPKRHPCPSGIEE